MRKGNVENQNYRTTLVTIFVDKIYLYDDYFRIILSYSPGDKTSDNESADIERYLNGQPLENSALEAQIQPIAGIVREYPDTAHQVKNRYFSTKIAVFLMLAATINRCLLFAGDMVLSIVNCGLFFYI